MPQPLTRDYWPTDGWRTASPADQGLDAAQLDAAQAYLNEHAPHIDSLLIVRGGYLVYEYDRTDAALHNVKSMTKSFASALTGIAIQAGDLAGTGEPIGSLLPEVFATVPDRAKREITVQDLLTMRSGLDLAEYGPSAVQMTASPDWVQFVLDRRLIHSPGTVFNYSTGDTQVLAAALQQVTGMALLDYADLYLFQPLGITQRHWPADPQGITIGGTELAITPRDMAKFGYLYLNGGVWDGDPIIPAGWRHESSTYHTRFPPRTAARCDTLGYGYLWWLRPQATYESMLAVGYGGQFVVVIPDLDVVVVMTGQINDAPESFRNNLMLCGFNLVEEYIVPAVTGG